MLDFVEHDCGGREHDLKSSEYVCESREHDSKMWEDDFGKILWLCLVKGREMCYAGGRGEI